MVTTKKEEVIRIEDFEACKQEDSFEGIVTSIYIIS
jgi:hypothetical protein